MLKYSLLFCFCAQAAVLSEDAELRMVVEFSRHGSRTSSFNLNLALNPQEFKGKKLLTDFGYQEHVEKGKRLRERYREFLPLEYDAEAIVILAT